MIKFYGVVISCLFQVYPGKFRSLCRMMAILPIILFFPGVGSTAPPVIGMNLTNITYWSRELVFTDAFRTCMPWITQAIDVTPGEKPAWNTGFANVMPLSANAYPSGIPFRPTGSAFDQIAATLMRRGQDGHYPSGAYLCQYAGDGELAFGLDARILFQNPGHIRLMVTPSNKGIFLKIVRSNPDDPIRNIRVFPENANDPNRFNPLFLERIKPFRVLRFMGWQAVNDSPVVLWSQRTRPEHYTQQQPGGMNLETMIDLCNHLAADPWFCMPHQADDTYIRQFAALVKHRLDPARRIYLEYSNEVWNPQFAQHEFVLDGKPSKTLPKRYARNARNVFDIWHDEFGHNRSRVVRVLAGQQHNVWFLEQAVAEIGAASIDALACGGYFGLQPEDLSSLKKLGSQTTIETVMDMAIRQLGQKAIPGLAAHADLAKRLGRDFYVYEGGQHLIPDPPGSSPDYLPAIVKAQSSGQMADAYMTMLQAFVKMGGDLFMAFGFVSDQKSPWGAWGHLDHLSQSPADSPKFKALLEHMNQTQPDATIVKP
ncbi:MAG: hypothetical protein AB7S77_09025 [Desulfatirhabdiaceae bacterium]